MPIGNVSRDSGPQRRDSFRPPWVKEKDTETLPSWTQKKLKPVENINKTSPVENDEVPAIKPLKRKFFCILEKKCILSAALQGIYIP